LSKPSAEEFYDFAAPAELQQGDIVPGAPLISIPPSNTLVLVRNAHNSGRPEQLASGNVRLVPEQSVDAFPEGESEYVVVSARRGMAMVVTQTCTIARSENLLVCPIYATEGAELNVGLLFSSNWRNSYVSLFGLPPHPYFDSDHYVDLGDVRSVYSGGIRVADRIASLSLNAQYRLNDKMAWMFTREWGFAEGEQVPSDGKYRCRRCIRFLEVPVVERTFKKGDIFEACPVCGPFNHHSQWYQLEVPKKKKK
jgi:hypothetical protein